MTAPASGLDSIDQELLDELQRRVPYVPRPFAEVGRRLGITEQEALQRLRALRDGHKIIRQISAIFDTAALGYQSALVAARYGVDDLDRAATIVSAHPGVSHNYQRSAALNLWYTLAVPPDSALGLQPTIELLHGLSGAEVTRPLPTLKLYKIGVRLDMGDVESEAQTVRGFREQDREAAREHRLDERDIGLIGVLQQHLKLVEEPWAPWARQAGCSVAELLEACERFERRGQMRRFAAVLRHRQAGFTANVMAVWKAPEAEADRFGEMAGGFRAVSHCYLRQAYEDWPYNVYTMVHGRSRAEALAVLDDIQGRGNVGPYTPLWSVKEYKKVRLRYFTPEIAEWEKEHASEGGGS